MQFLQCIDSCILQLHIFPWINFAPFFFESHFATKNAKIAPSSHSVVGKPLMRCIYDVSDCIGVAAWAMDTRGFWGIENRESIQVANFCLFSRMGTFQVRARTTQGLAQSPCSDRQVSYPIVCLNSNCLAGQIYIYKYCVRMPFAKLAPWWPWK